MSLVIAAAQSMSVPGNIPQNVARHLRFGAMAAENGVRLLIFPELSLTGYEPAIARTNAVRPNAPDLDPLRRLAQKARLTMVVGAPMLNEKDELHIGALLVRPDGSEFTYTKQYLHAGEEKVFAPGQGGPTLKVDDAKVALAICADTTHPQHPASAAARGANVYAAGVLITEKGYAPDTALLRGYAAEHKMVVLMANHSGVTGGWVSAGKSAVWSEDGRLVVASPGTEESLVICRRQDNGWEGTVLRVTSPPAHGKNGSSDQPATAAAPRSDIARR